MGNKISLILSLLLFAQTVLFCVDLIGLQMTLTTISAQSVYIMRQIEKDKGISEELANEVEKEYNVRIVCVNADCIPDEHNLLDIKIIVSYEPILSSFLELGVSDITLHRKVLIE